jgi:hypothetical protein
MNNLKETKSPTIEVPLSSIEMSQIRDGVKFTWECTEKHTGEKITVIAYYDKAGDYITEEVQ